MNLIHAFYSVSISLNTCTVISKYTTISLTLGLKLPSQTNCKLAEWVMLRKIVSKNDLKIKNYHKKNLERAVSKYLCKSVHFDCQYFHIQ